MKKQVWIWKPCLFLTPPSFGLTLTKINSIHSIEVQEVTFFTHKKFSFFDTPTPLVIFSLQPELLPNADTQEEEAKEPQATMLVKTLF